ncbi:MAG: transcription elongation factor Spt5 [Candidatus Lokiarchaeota archaeon]
MARQEEKVDDEPTSEIDVDDFSKTESMEEAEDLTTIFAIRTTINQESNVLKQIFYRFRILETIPDIKAMLISPLLPGYVFIEAPLKRDVQIAIQGIPHIKGRIVGQIPLESILHVLSPRSVTEYLEVGDTVEIISGVFEGSRAMVMRMPHDSSSSEEVVVRLLQEETPITIKIHGDYLKLVEKKKEEEREKPVAIEMGTEETITDLDKAITFDDDFESEFEEETPDYSEISENETEKWEEEEEELEEEDEWSKFDGF